MSGLALDELAASLRAEMGRQRLTTRSVGEQWGLSKATVSRACNGKPVSAYATIALCVVTGIDPVWLLKDTQP